MDKSYWLVNALPLIPLIAAVIYGFFRVFRSKTPLYFRIAVLAIFCALLEYVNNSLVLLCSENGYVIRNLGGLAMGGFCAFMFAANYGQFDSIVDGGQKQYRHCRILAWIAPIVLLIPEVISDIMMQETDILYLVLCAVLDASILPCSYFNLKVILMKDDGTGFIKGAKPINVISLLYIVLENASAYLLEGYLVTPMIVIYYITIATCIAGVFCVDWGRKQWMK